MNTELITVPTFTFFQGDHGASEPSIQVSYYAGDIIELQQDDDVIHIEISQLNNLFKEIKKHIPEAIAALNR